MKPHARKSTFFVAAMVLFRPAILFADSTSEGWTWQVGCAASGTSQHASFASSTSGGFAGVGNCSRTSTHFTKFDFASSSGGTLNSLTQYALHTGDLLVLPPLLDTETAPVFMAQTTCPQSNQNYN